MSLDDSYEFYKKEKSNEALNAVIKDLKPTISYSLSNLNAHKDPVVRAKAKSVAAKSVQTYDPNFGASLKTHVSNQLKQLSRTVRQQRSPTKAPERQQLDALTIDRAEKEYFDKEGKEPDVNMLADNTGLSPKRIEKVRSSSFRSGTDREDDAENDLPSGVEESDYTKDAIKYVYDVSDYKDRKIIEHKLGYGGGKILNQKQISEQLNLNPAQVSRRAAKLTKEVSDLVEALKTH